ncbi:MAG: hypothetical protein HDR03_05395 [Lachnospiraceae bacterium]|nr:hypothetical protein [Lachnospiraceae bacterium]
MDKIQESAVNFLNLVNTTSYVFHLANRTVRVVSLNFMLRDFHHVVGFQYLTDINIPRNKNNTISWILNKDNPITDEYLAKSNFYKGKPNDEKDIESRIEQLCFLEQYLDQNNIIRIYSPKDGPQNNSLIRCDYIIESQLAGSHTIVYIFLKYRNGIGSPCAIISFGVKKNVAYGGQNLYWMLKDKIINGVRQTIYQHPKYTLEQKLKNEPTITST